MADGKQPPPGELEPGAADAPGSTVSGLREDQIDRADLEQLRAACKLHQLLPRCGDDAGGSAAQWIEPVLDDARVHGIELAIDQPQAFRLRMAPLPKKARVLRVRIPAQRPALHRDLHLALSQPIQRRRMHQGELSKAQELELYRQLYEKYGPAAGDLVVQAVFAHIPPEAAQTCCLSPDLRYLQFTFPTDVSPRGAEAGHYLVVLHDGEGETRRVLFRL